MGLEGEPPELENWTIAHCRRRGEDKDHGKGDPPLQRGLLASMRTADRALSGEPVELVLGVSVLCHTTSLASTPPFALRHANGTK